MRIIKNLTAMIAAAILVTGCATVETESWQNCAIAGAALGGAAGGFHNSDHEVEEAAIGAAAGAIIGGTICALMAEDEAVIAQETDTDGDGVADYKDECPDTEPGAVVNELGCVDVLVLEGVEFHFDSADLTDAAKDVLRPIAEMHHIHHGKVDLIINGYTSSEGAEAYNQGLSQRRAESVRAFMIEAGCFAERLTAIGHGEANPVADNGTAEGREQNRRVEIDIKK